MAVLDVSCHGYHLPYHDHLRNVQLPMLSSMLEATSLVSTQVISIQCRRDHDIGKLMSLMWHSRQLVLHLLPRFDSISAGGTKHLTRLMTRISQRAQTRRWKRWHSDGIVILITDTHCSPTERIWNTSKLLSYPSSSHEGLRRSFRYRNAQ